MPAYPPSPLGLLSHHGPIARSVADAAAMLNTIAQHDDRDPYALPPDDRDWRDELEGGVKGWRIGFSADLGYAQVDPEIADAVAAAARRFEGLGAIVEEVGELFPSPREQVFTLWASGVAALLRGYPDVKKHLVDPGLRETAAAGERISAADSGCGRFDAHLGAPHGRISSHIRSVADADDAGARTSGWAGSERPGNRAALARLVAVQLSVHCAAAARARGPGWPRSSAECHWTLTLPSVIFCPDSI